MCKYLCEDQVHSAAVQTKLASLRTRGCVRPAAVKTPCLLTKPALDGVHYRPVDTRVSGGTPLIFSASALLRVWLNSVRLG